jgi:hypothetical protein
MPECEADAKSPMIVSYERSSSLDERWPSLAREPLLSSNSPGQHTDSDEAQPPLGCCARTSAVVAHAFLPPNDFSDPRQLLLSFTTVTLFFVLMPMAVLVAMSSGMHRLEPWTQAAIAVIAVGAGPAAFVARYEICLAR